jgi:nucleotide-binding universal stress UspA family protein
MKLLVAFDAREHSVFALEQAAQIAAAGAAEITVLSVVPPDARGTKSGGHVGMAPHADADVEYAQAYLAVQGIEAATKVAHGDPADEILRTARDADYDLIVVGTRELGPIGGRLLGSVSRKVVRDAACPVVVAGRSGVTRSEPALATLP